MATRSHHWLLTCSLLISSVTAMAADPPGESLPAGAVARLGSVRLRHGGPVKAIVFSPDGKWFATASADGTARVWEAETGKETARLPHEGEVRALVMTPDGRHIATAGADRIVHLWDAATGREAKSFTGHEDRVDALAFSTDGKTLASGGRDGQLRLWDVSGNGPPQSTKFDSGLAALTWASDGKTLGLATADGNVLLWNAPTKRETRRLDTVYASALAFAPDGRVLAGGLFDRQVKLWDVAEGKETRTLLRSPRSPRSRPSAWRVRCRVPRRRQETGHRRIRRRHQDLGRDVRRGGLAH